MLELPRLAPPKPKPLKPKPHMLELLDLLPEPLLTATPTVKMPGPALREVHTSEDKPLKPPKGRLLKAKPLKPPKVKPPKVLLHKVKRPDSSQGVLLGLPKAKPPKAKPPKLPNGRPSETL